MTSDRSENHPSSSAERNRSTENPSNTSFSLSRSRSVALLLGGIALFTIFIAYWAVVAEIVQKQFLDGRSIEYFFPTFFTLGILAIGTVLFLAISRFFIARHLESRGRKKETKLLLSLYSYVVWLLTIILMLSTIFADKSIFVASLGLIGVALTFALQKPILNFVGWLTIVFNKPFSVGDCIEVNNLRGYVSSISTMYSTLQLMRPNTMDKSEMIVTIPNEVILTNPVINLTKRLDVYWDAIDVNITYGSNWRKAETLLYEATLHVMRRFITLPAEQARKDRKRYEGVIALLEEARRKLAKGVLRSALSENIETMRTIERESTEELPLPVVRMGFGDSWINLNVLFLTDVRRVAAMKSEVARGFLAAVEKHDDIQIAFPHLQIVYNSRNTNMRKMPRLNEFDDPREPEVP